MGIGTKWMDIYYSVYWRRFYVSGGNKRFVHHRQALMNGRRPPRERVRNAPVLSVLHFPHFLGYQPIYATRKRQKMISEKFISHKVSQVFSVELHK